MKGQFWVVEGLGGSGKSTLTDKIEQWLIDTGLPYVRTREPGGTEAAEFLRPFCRNGFPDMKPLDPMTTALLFNAARNENTKDIILPALEAGKIVLCDRYCDSTFSFQHAVGIGKLRKLHELVHGIYPDMTFLLDGNPRIFQERIRPEEKVGDQFDRLLITMLDVARINYLGCARDLDRADTYHVIDAEVNPDQVYAQVLPILMHKLNKIKQRPKAGAQML
jgi:dTMP kinase